MNISDTVRRLFTHVLALPLLFVSQYVQAQEYNMVIMLKNGTEISVSADSIETVRFDTLAVAHADQESVDLGLSVRWAVCNLGASSPEEYGNLYSWGEIMPKDDYAEDRYAYFVNESYQPIGQNISGTVFDAARSAWGADWRMPVRQEMEELQNECEWTKETLNGVSGYKVTGPSGNSIFLPAAGYSSGSQRKHDGTEGYYWSGTLSDYQSSSAYNMNFKGYNTSWTASRAYGFSIRAVRK